MKGLRDHESKGIRVSLNDNDDNDDDDDEWGREEKQVRGL